MKKLLFCLLLVSVFMTSCKDDNGGEVKNELSVIIHKPAEGAMFTTNDANVHIHVDAGATVDLHNVSIVIHPAGDASTKIYDVSEHGEGTDPYAHHADVDMSNFTAGDYVIEVVACGAHMCEGENELTLSNSFTVQ